MISLEGFVIKEYLTKLGKKPYNSADLNEMLCMRTYRPVRTKKFEISILKNIKHFYLKSTKKVK